jgi:hypothetical protein
MRRRNPQSNSPSLNRSIYNKIHNLFKLFTFKDLQILINTNCILTLEGNKKLILANFVKKIGDNILRGLKVGLNYF